jgi:hypothetical protein
MYVALDYGILMDNELGIIWKEDAIHLERLKKPTKKSVSTLGVRAEIQTGDLPNTSQKQCHLTTFLGSMNNLVIIVNTS